MPRIHILGASGVGTTTLARALAAALGCPALDADDFYWEPTDPPFESKRPPHVRVELLRAALNQSADSVLSGSMCGWGDPLIPLFDRVVLLTLDPVLRMQRLREREASRFGAQRIAAGGDLYEKHQAFMRWAERYDDGGMDVRSRRLHDSWIQALPSRIRVLRLDSAQPVDTLLAAVLSSADE